MQEKIIVLEKEKIFENTIIKEGFFPLDTVILENIKKYSFEYDKDLAELNTSLKQIVCYIIYFFKDKLFFMQRSKKKEKALTHKFSIGIGGHLQKEDISKDEIFWFEREFNEEINYNDSYQVKLLGFINDNSDSIGEIHFGVVYAIQGDTPEISIKSELKSGKLISLDECLSYRKSTESWSKILLIHLTQNRSIR